MRAQLGPLTMVDARRSRRNQPSDTLRGGLVCHAQVLLHTNGTLYKGIAEHKIASSDLCHSSVVSDEFHSPAKVVTVWLYGVTVKDILQVASVKTRVRQRFWGELMKRKPTSSSETLSTQCTHKSVPRGKQRDIFD
jgi:hypothetical protein